MAPSWRHALESSFPEAVGFKLKQAYSRYDRAGAGSVPASAVLLALNDLDMDLPGTPHHSIV